MRNGLSLSHDRPTDLNAIQQEWTANDNKVLERLTQTCAKDNNNLEDVI